MQVTWDGPDDPENPKNWSYRRKWAATLTVSSFTFISPVSSSMVAPALSTLATEFHITSQVESGLVMSIFILAYAVGPLFYGPLSEIYGRVIVLQLANLFYLVWNLVCGFAHSKAQIIVFRFFSGLGGSAPLAIGGGLLSDCWHAEERGRSIAIYSLAPLLGPAIGPLIGGFVTQYSSWRWVFWATSIADAVIQISGLFLLQETYPPKLLRAKAARIRQQTGDDRYFSDFDRSRQSTPALRTIASACVRPFRMITTQPIIQAIALYMAYLYGLMYLVLSTFSSLWTESYHMQLGIAGLNYIALGIGFMAGTQIGSRISDLLYKRLRDASPNKQGRPEFRVPMLFVSSMFTPIGLFIYGWTAHYRTFWIGPDIGSAFIAAGIVLGFQSMQTYVVDAYTRFAASGIAATTVLRSLAGFGFPLFAPYMYSALGIGWGNSLLGFIAVGAGGISPFLLWRYGEKLRAKSTFAAG